jgi:elongation factor Ts
VTEISAALVKQLRDATSAGMMDCKRALQETEGDFDAAVKLLRERGMASAAKRAGRETTEGEVAVAVDDGVGALVAVGCETEPVSNNDEFKAFLRRALETVESGGDVASLETERAELAGKLGENIQVVGATRMETSDDESFSSYVHPPANKVGVLVKTKGGTPELARQLAMHISFARPTYASREEVPADLVEAERAILEQLDEVQSKPENVRGKIVEGMLNKRFYGESVLGEQSWIHDTNLTVSKALDQGGLTLVDYAWYSVS